MSNLTGKQRYRVGWGKKIILQVEKAGETTDPLDCSTYEHTWWEDATPEDLLPVPNPLPHHPLRSVADMMNR